MTKEQFNQVKSLDTAVRRGSAVLSAITKYRQDKKKQGIFIQLEHEYYMSMVNVCFPEIEDAVLDLLEHKYNELMTMWVQELRNIRGEIYGH